ncbi:MAG: hypothetical protein GOMPHAMPRED_006639 [Gomphillus americanus]|uniref:Uncharacterized protein n=1 Tax=Gomphillus americanus TaxID=1940652 RepID=A0A8H3FXC0_9LECA|nr:MAG: hypothetical protein GOMPHAMPRED_006639 [Gomphillus americanus]
MANRAPQEYGCYFMISPSTDDAPGGITDQNPAPNPPPGGWGPMFYIRFGDGNWHNGRYTTHNPSFAPGSTDNCANIPGTKNTATVRYYQNGNQSVNAGGWLQLNILHNWLQQHMNREWYRIHAPPGVQVQHLAADLMWISDRMDDVTLDLGYQAALNVYQQQPPGTLLQL